jgi:hypothetical protein
MVTAKAMLPVRQPIVTQKAHGKRLPRVVGQRKALDMVVEDIHRTTDTRTSRLPEGSTEVS